MTVRFTFFGDGDNLVVEGPIAHKEVDEAGAGNVDLADQFAVAQRANDVSRQVTRVFARRFGESHRNVRCKVAMPRSRARSTVVRIDALDVVKRRQTRQGVIDEFGNAGFQGQKRLGWDGRQF